MEKGRKGGAPAPPTPAGGRAGGFKLSWDLDPYLPSRRTVVIGLFALYFFIVAGAFYDMIADTIAFGQNVDPNTGRVTMETIMPYRLNSQYIVEGLLAGAVFVTGAVGFVVLDWASAPGRFDVTSRGRYMTAGLAMIVMMVIVSWFLVRVKMPGYLTTFSA